LRSGHAIGVELTTGEQIHSTGFIASGLNPQQTFLELLPPQALAASVREKAAQYQYNLLAPLLGLHLALDEPPSYAAAQSRPQLNEAFMVILGLERFDQFHEIVAAHERGEIPPPVAWGACPTLFDPSQAPPGKHSAFLWEKLPYALHGDRAIWAKEKDAHGERLLKLWTEMAPNHHSPCRSVCHRPRSRRVSLHIFQPVPNAPYERNAPQSAGRINYIHSRRVPPDSNRRCHKNRLQPGQCRRRENPWPRLSRRA